MADRQHRDASPLPGPRRSALGWPERPDPTAQPAEHLGWPERRPSQEAASPTWAVPGRGGADSASHHPPADPTTPPPAPAFSASPRPGIPDSAPPSRSGARTGGLALLLGSLLVGVLGGLGGGLAAHRLGHDDAAPVVVEALPALEVGGGGGSPVSAVAQRVLPSVVFISVDAPNGTGVGSGFVIREDGYIVTNNHVIEAAADGGTVEVELADDEVVEAEIVGRDVPYDIAVLKVDREGLAALPFGDSAGLAVGQEVVAVGAPLGLDSTVTAGIVSALDRPVTTGNGDRQSFINAIQTDAAINPGNSGGPLVDLAGRVVGVNSAIAQIPDVLASGPSGSIGLGFAIPADQVERTATQLIETGTSQHPVIGVFVDNSYTGEGARVFEESPEVPAPVVAGGPADRAGIRPGETILAVDGERIENSAHLIVTLRSRRIGDEVELLVRDGDGQERTVTVQLEGSAE